MALQVRTQTSRELAVRKDLEDLTVRDVMSASFMSVYNDANALDALDSKEAATAYVLAKTAEIYRGLAGEEPPAEASAAIAGLVNANYDRVVAVCNSQPMAVLGALRTAWSRTADQPVLSGLAQSLGLGDDAVRQIDAATASALADLSLPASVLGPAAPECALPAVAQYAVPGCASTAQGKRSWVHTTATWLRLVAPDVLLMLICVGLCF